MGTCTLTYCEKQFVEAVGLLPDPIESGQEYKNYGIIRKKYYDLKVWQPSSWGDLHIEIRPRIEPGWKKYGDILLKGGALLSTFPVIISPVNWEEAADRVKSRIKHYTNDYGSFNRTYYQNKRMVEALEKLDEVLPEGVRKIEASASGFLCYPYPAKTWIIRFEFNMNTGKYDFTQAIEAENSLYDVPLPMNSRIEKSLKAWHVEKVWTPDELNDWLKEFKKTEGGKKCIANFMKEKLS